jgi:hypothetical protein
MAEIASAQAVAGQIDAALANGTEHRLSTDAC